MKTETFSEYSPSLERDISYRVYGSSGKLSLVFPPQNGRFYDFENFHMIDSISHYIESGKMLVVAVDGIDGETFSGIGDERKRIERHEAWFDFIADTLIPIIKKKYKLKGKALATGCSMGGYHSANFFFRRPDLFDTVISLSGLYEASFFFGEYYDDLIYKNSPSLFLRDMGDDDKRKPLYLKSKIILCTGQGRWEENMIQSLRNMNISLFIAHIPAWVDFWGRDVDHDWPWWQRQLPYFLSMLEEFK